MRHIIGLHALLLLVACAQTMAPLPRLSDADISDDAPVLGAVPRINVADPAPGGFFTRLFGGEAENAETDSDTPTSGEDIDVSQTEPESDENLPPEAYGVASDLPGKGGLFGLLGSKSQTTQTSVTKASLEQAGTDGHLAADRPGPSLTPTARKGFFGIGGAETANSEIAPGTILPYGRVARICGPAKRSLGTKVEQFPANRPRHVLYDSDPGNTSPHTFYLTGFDDGCVRQFTASLAVFGSVEMHEQLRYGLPAEVQPYSDTDKAYERLKSRVCGVARKMPCGTRRSKLERDTVFLSIYERYGSNARWSNLLLHRGQVLAQDSKGG